MVEEKKLEMGANSKMKFKLITVAVGLAVFLLGGTITIGGITIKNPLQDQIRNMLIEDDYVLRRQLESYHAITTVLTVLKAGEGLSEATLMGGSIRAANFFGIEHTDIDDRLIGKSGRGLLEILKPFMSEEDFKEFSKDQSQMFKHYGDAAPAIAKIPVVFNDQHKYYAGEAFLPVIVSLGNKVKKDEKETQRIILIAYLNVQDLAPAVEYLEKRRERED